MAKQHHHVRLVNKIGEFSEGEFLYDEEEDDEACCLTFRCSHGEFKANAADYFEAMCIIRGELQKIGLFPICNGASLNVFPSGMGRDMGRGLMAYRLEIGRHATRQDMLFIFGCAAALQPVGVEEQAAFYQEWLRSIRSL